MFSLKVQVDETARKGESSQSSSEIKQDEIVSEHDRHTVLKFSAGNPSVERISGKIRLFRDVSKPDDVDTLPSLPEDRGKDVCILAVPAHIPVNELCNFFGGLLSNIEEMRIVRDEANSLSAYTVLITFDTIDNADECYLAYNWKPFNSLESEKCHILYVANVEYTEIQADDTFLRDSPRLDGSCSSSSHQTELPTCPVCLERLDQHISGIFTTVCNHTFHCECLSKWQDSTCPVCRYMTSPAEASHCQECDQTDYLWMCLICGYVGCGRYSEGHAREHWRETNHCYSIELQTQRVWDYAGDGYVHRLIQSNTNGKFVELGSPGGPGRGGPSGGESSSDCLGKDMEEAMVDSKLDAIALEYNTLLTQQLESQRHYFEGLLATSTAENAKLRAGLVGVGSSSAKQGKGKHSKGKSGASAEIVDGDEQADAERSADLLVAATQQKMRDLENKCKALEKHKQEAMARERRLEEEKMFLRQLNESLMSNQKQLKEAIEASTNDFQAKLRDKDAKLADLEEQVRDLMVFIEAQRTLATDDSSALKNASLLPVPEPSPSPPSSSKSMRMKRR